MRARVRTPCAFFLQVCIRERERDRRATIAHAYTFGNHVLKIAAPINMTSTDEVERRLTSGLFIERANNNALAHNTVEQLGQTFFFFK